MKDNFSMAQRLLAEGLGTAMLLAVVVGSGIMGENLAAGNDGIALLANTLATGAILIVLILIFGPISGAHFNPAVTLAFLLRKEISPQHAFFYVLIQIITGVIGVLIAHLMFDLPVISYSSHIRNGIGQWTGELVAAFGLVLTILGCLHFRPGSVAYAVGLFISAGYWFTSSTSFANPAVTIARMLTDSFTGIRPFDVPGFIAAEIIGALLAVAIARYLFAGKSS